MYTVRVCGYMCVWGETKGSELNIHVHVQCFHGCVCVPGGAEGHDCACVCAWVETGGCEHVFMCVFVCV